MASSCHNRRRECATGQAARQGDVLTSRLRLRACLQPVQAREIRAGGSPFATLGESFVAWRVRHRQQIPIVGS